MSDIDSLHEPFSLEAEQGLIGAMLIKPELIGILSADVKAADFFFAYNRDVFNGIMRLAQRGAPVDVLTVADEVGELSNGDSALAYTAQLYQNTPSAANAKAYAAIVLARSIDRALVMASNNIHEIAYGAGGAEDKISQAQAEIMVIHSGSSEQETITAAQAIGLHVEELERRESLGGKIDGLTTGIKVLDDALLGLKPEQLIVIAGRPKMGKTTLAQNIADHVAIDLGKQVLVFSLEMSHKQLMDKSLSSRGAIPIQALRDGTAMRTHSQSLLTASGIIAASGLTLFDRKGATINKIRSVARRHRLNHGVDLILVDHIGLVGVEDVRANSVARISEITRELKLLARELNCPIIALSQLNRQLEARPNKRPVPSDLRDSGSIEQDADVILFVYRDDYYYPDSEYQGVAELIIGAARDVEACTVRARYQGNYSVFSDLAANYQEPTKKPQRSYSSSSLLD